MKRVLVLVALTLSASATAGPRHKVIVLPVDGNADAATRTKLTQSVQRLARVIEGEVTPGNTTLSETAAAVGCDPEKPACVDQVRTTLGYDEVVYGVATKRDGEVTVVVHRAAKGKDARSVTATLGAKESPEKIEPTLLPLFTGAAASGTSTPPPSDTPVEDKPVDKPPTEDKPVESKPPDTVTGTQNLGSGTPPPEGTHLRRNLAITACGAGGLMVLIGLGLWSSASSLQQEIDEHSTDNVDDFIELRALEDKAQTRAIAGDLMVLGGLALGGVGGWILWKDHKAQRMSVAPAPIDKGAGVTFTFVGGPW